MGRLRIHMGAEPEIDSIICFEKAGALKEVFGIERRNHSIGCCIFYRRGIILIGDDLTASVFNVSILQVQPKELIGHFFRIRVPRLNCQIDSSSVPIDNWRRRYSYPGKDIWPKNLPYGSKANGRYWIAQRLAPK